MNKLIFILIATLFLNNCSFNENSKIWKDQKKIDQNKKIIKVITEDKNVVSEFNTELKLDLSLLKLSNKVVDNQNNLGPQNYKGELNKEGSFVKVV